jgi:hypothetical protein
MISRDTAVIQHLVTTSTLGSFFGMALMGWLLWFDVAGVGTMFSASQRGFLMNLSLAGIMMKGGLIGFVLGLVTIRTPKNERQPRTDQIPATQANPS